MSLRYRPVSPASSCAYASIAQTAFGPGFHVIICIRNPPFWTYCRASTLIDERTEAVVTDMGPLELHFCESVESPSGVLFPVPEHRGRYN
jgi:hypothetical protein